MAGAAIPAAASPQGGGLLQSLLGTQGLPRWQQALAGLQAASPLFQRHQQPGGMLGGLLQGVGQARQWAGAQRGLPQAPRMPNITPGMIPGSVAMPNITPPVLRQGQPGPQVLPPPPAMDLGYTIENIPWANLGFGGMR